MSPSDAWRLFRTDGDLCFYYDGDLNSYYGDWYYGDSYYGDLSSTNDVNWERYGPRWPMMVTEIGMGRDGQ